MASSTSVSVSAPGKVLLAGGYLVLDRHYTGLVFGLDARIHCHVAPLKTAPGVRLETVVVRSPQFREATWKYGYRYAERDGGFEVTQLTVSAESVGRNPFVETALAYALTYIAAVSNPVIQPTTVTILADDSYYTTQPAGTSAEGKTFHDFGVKLSDAHKTGLGSSAALVTSLTGALLSYYLPVDVFSITRDVDKRRLHNLAQAAHCAAQGKVGSGFDVASAVYGSCLYRRFSPSLLDRQGSPGTPGFGKQLKQLVDESSAESTWDTEIAKDKVKVPKGVRLVMCDVDCGSQTPGMVKQVLAWRKKEPEEADMLWAQLHKQNEGLAADITALADAEDKDHTPLGERIASIRQYIREMSRLSGVPIEPPPQTELLDACTGIEGVIGGVVPGAGGFDAVALLIEDNEEVLKRLDRLFDSYQVAAYRQGSTEPSLGRVSRLPVREEMDGVRVEDAAGYGPWIS